MWTTYTTLTQRQDDRKVTFFHGAEFDTILIPKPTRQRDRTVEAGEERVAVSKWVGKRRKVKEL